MPEVEVAEPETDSLGSEVAQKVTRSRPSNRETVALIVMSAGAIVLPVIGWIIGARFVRGSSWWTDDERYAASRWPWIVTLTLAVIFAYLLAHQTFALDTGSKLVDIVLPPVLFVIVATPVIAAGILAWPVARAEGWFTFPRGSTPAKPPAAD